MATNYEQIQADLAACNITLWEPEKLTAIQLNPCRMQCLENELALMATKVTDAANALQDIENVATADSGIEDVAFVNASLADDKIVWDMSPTTSGAIRFAINKESAFYKEYILPNVSTLLVPVTEDDGNGGTVPRSEYDIAADRDRAMQNPINAIETTIVALNAYKDIVSAKRTQLEATYA